MSAMLILALLFESTESGPIACTACFTTFATAAGIPLATFNACLALVVPQAICACLAGVLGWELQSVSESALLLVSHQRHEIFVRLSRT